MSVVFRFFWALFLSLIVVIAFLQTWEWEHGGRRRAWQEQNETVIYMSPLVFPIVIGIYGVMDLAVYGMKDGTVQFSKNMADIFICMSVYFIILLVFLPVLRKCFSARVCAALWLVPVLLFFQPHILFSDAPYTPADGVHMLTIYVPGSILQRFTYIWAAGFVLLFGWQIVSNFQFRRRLMAGATAVEDAGILEIWEKERKRLKYGKPIQLLYSPNAATPLSVGTHNKSRATFLPECDFTMEELRLIFRHELHHIQRRDVDTKVFLGFCKALFWFNPLTWLAVRKASDDLELACDEIALRRADESERRRYAELLLCTAGSSQGFSTCLSAAAASLRYRLKNVVKPRKRRVGALLLAIAMFCCCMGYGSIVFVSERGTLGELGILDHVAAEDITELEFYDYEEAGLSKCYSIETCDDELLSWLSGLKVEKLFSGSEFNDGKTPEFTCYIGDECSISLTDGMLTVFGGKDEGYYMVRSVIHWNDVRECFKNGQKE